MFYKDENYNKKVEVVVSDKALSLSKILKINYINDYFYL